MSLLNGLEKFGIKIENIEAVSQQRNENAEKAHENSKTVVEIKEEDLVFPREYKCPVCDRTFKQPAVKGSKIRVVSTDKDLRPVHNCIDTIKYDIVHCNRCGYAVLSRYFAPLPKPHKDLLKTHIESSYKPMLEVGHTIAYSQAFSKYQLAIANAKCRMAKASELSLIYLKMGWLIRGMIENIDSLPKQKKEFNEENLKSMEEEALNLAMKGFMDARLSENSPIAGMNEVTLDYLLAVLCMRFEDYDNAGKFIAGVISNQQAGAVQKDKARDLKQELNMLRKKANNE